MPAMWDEEPPPKPRRIGSVMLDALGVSELQEYVTELQAEITRVEAMIARKRDHRGAADSFFKR